MRDVVRVAALLTLTVAWSASAVTAQRARGRLVTPGGEPVAGALVVLLDRAGAEVARAATTASGGFALQAAASGEYRVLVRQIGQVAWHSAPLSLRAGAHHPLTLTVEPRPYRLPPITVAARSSRCDVSLGDSDILGRLLDAAGTALGVAEETAEAGDLRFSTDSYLKRLTVDLAVADSTSTGMFGLARWPIESADPESLKAWGFVRTPPGSDQGPIYYGPDARILFSDWFLDSHCFKIEAVNHDRLTVRFEPERRNSRAGLAGRLVLDRRSLELQRLAFEYVGLPRWVPRQQAGGELRLRRLGSGAWVPTVWRLRAPLPARPRGGSRLRLHGWVETGGRVTAVRTAKGVDSTLTAEVLAQ